MFHISSVDQSESLKLRPTIDYVKDCCYSFRTQNNFSGSFHLKYFSSIIVLHVFDLNLIFWALWWILHAGLKRSCWNYSLRRLQTKQLDLMEEISLITIAQTWHVSCTFVLTHISNDGTFNSFSSLLIDIFALCFFLWLIF